MSDCSLCDRLLRGALEASKTYHDLVSDLEAAHIRRDANRALVIREELDKALVNRDKALAALHDHKHTHARELSGAS